MRENAPARSEHLDTTRLFVSARGMGRAARHHPAILAHQFSLVAAYLTNPAGHCFGKLDHGTLAVVCPVRIEAQNPEFFLDLHRDYLRRACGRGRVLKVQG
ncbi:hypothetical protein AB4Y36_39585 [Paraburkholderia sp. BR10936]|uniref:hypothetical protein n=1 Tax=Paraburkholderia sp. BR10936 TaxID=3236993 RepID=UPI0034D35686